MTPAQIPDDETIQALMGLHPHQIAIASALANGNGPMRPPEDPAQPRMISAPSGGARGINVPPVQGSTEDLEDRSAAPKPQPEAVPSQQDTDQAEFDRLKNSPSGIGGFQERHPVLGGIAHGLVGVASSLAPGIAANIPGTDQHHEQLLHQAAGRVEQDVGQQKEEAGIAETGAQTAHEQAQTEALQHPQPKVGETGEEQTIHDLMTGEGGQPRLNPKTNKPYTYLEAFEATKQAAQDVKPEPNPNDFEKFYADWIKDNHFPDSAHNRLLARAEFAKAGQPPQHDPQQLAIGPDNKVVALRPGATVAAGTKSVSADLGTGKPTADEQRRADLAENMNENLDQLEDIAKRRPDLFGPIAGRVTGLKETIGTSDPDVAALKTIQEQVGMAMVGAHAMRNAQHVATAANAIMNGFHNSPEAMLTAIKTARNSVKTFQGDVDKAKAGDTAPKATGNDPLGIR